MVKVSQQDSVDAARVSPSEWGPRIEVRELCDRAWENGEIIDGNDPVLWRKDEFGAWIHRLEYGNRRSEFGWELIDPAKGHSDNLARPMQWQNYVDQVAAHTQSRVTAAGLRNSRRLL